MTVVLELTTPADYFVVSRKGWRWHTGFRCCYHCPQGLQSRRSCQIQGWVGPLGICRCA